MSQYFAFWGMCYLNKWVTLEQVVEATSKGVITAEEFKTITGQDYSA